MRHKKSHTKNRKEVFVDEVAKLLPVNTPFDRIGFSSKTGIAENSSYQRLNKLVDKGFLTISGKTGNRILYTMSKKQQAAMIKEGQSNKFKHSKRSNTQERIFTVEEIQEAEIEAHHEQAERIFKDIKFI